MLQAVLFDFDGTLADTAADLSRALNRLRTARRLPELPLEALRPHASSGARGLRWGIVTNKSTKLTRMVVKALGLEARTACVVCGDTTPHLKPNPASLLYAAKELALAPQACVYLGDDLRDVQAARSAGMSTVAVEWGYGEHPAGWQADAVIARPMDLLGYLALSP